MTNPTTATPCRYEDENACRQSWHLDDGIPYCDACGMFRWSINNQIKAQARQAAGAAEYGSWL